jgi:hypothetical protein
MSKTIDKHLGDCYSGVSQEKHGCERDKYLFVGCRELRVGATQERTREKSTRKPTRKRQRSPRYRRRMSFSTITY